LGDPATASQELALPVFTEVALVCSIVSAMIAV
jgi:hypothetical protein